MEMSNETSRFAVVAMIWLRPGGTAALRTFREQGTALFARHDMRISREIQVAGKGQVVGENHFEKPDLIQVLTFPSPDGFRAYLADPDYIALAPDRDAAIQRMTVCAGSEMPLDGIATAGCGPEVARFYGVGLVRFKPGGSAGLDAFNRQGQAVFKRHGLHVEAMVDVARVLTPIGTADDMAPERIVVFFFDDPAAFPAYVSDPDYLRLAPLRDQGLHAYDVFTGSLLVLDEATA